MLGYVHFKLAFLLVSLSTVLTNERLFASVNTNMHLQSWFSSPAFVTIGTDVLTANRLTSVSLFSIDILFLACKSYNNILRSLSDWRFSEVKFEGIWEGRITVVFVSKEGEIREELVWEPILLNRSRTDESYFLEDDPLLLVPLAPRSPKDAAWAISGFRFFTSGEVLKYVCNQV